jgi:hypothetical protein
MVADVTGELGSTQQQKVKEETLAILVTVNPDVG